MLQLVLLGSNKYTDINKIHVKAKLTTKGLKLVYNKMRIFTQITIDFYIKERYYITEDLFLE